MPVRPARQGVHLMVTVGGQPEQVFCARRKACHVQSRTALKRSARPGSSVTSRRGYLP